MNYKKPSVSVVMPVYNQEKFVQESIQSILLQSFDDFEFIIIDDGSTDSTFEILQSNNDKRIKLIRKKVNQGHNIARNQGMEIAKGKYICVMDSDDIALPYRIETQFNFLETNRRYGICGSFAKLVGSDQILSAPHDYDEIKVWLLCNIMFRHPTIFIRTESLKKHKLTYNTNYRYAADYDLLVRASHLFPVTNIQEVLLEYRKHPEQISSAKKIEQGEVVRIIIIDQLSFFKTNIIEDEKKLHFDLMKRRKVNTDHEFKRLLNWSNTLLELNNKTGYYNSRHLARFLNIMLKSKLG